MGSAGKGRGHHHHRGCGCEAEMLTDAKPLTVDLAYINAWEDETGHVEWILFNQDGEIIMHSDNRSRVFFFAAEHDIDVRMVN